MRITVVAANGFHHDRRATALVHQLRGAGAAVTVVAVGVDDDPVAGVVGVASRLPAGRGTVGSWARRVQPAGVRQRVLTHTLADAAAATRPALLYPTTVAAVPAAAAAARRAGGAVVVDPRWDPPEDVWATRTLPGRPTLGGEHGLPHHRPDGSSDARLPVADRHAGARLVLVGRQRRVSPARHLRDALERAGVDVLVAEDALDTDDLPDDVLGVVVVESPLPAVAVTGPPARVPTAFWVHHGEHHLDANVRLAARYGVDHVLLAHSWHLAHRFAVPTTRFPFGLPHAPGVGGRAWADRRADVAMVGAHLTGGGPYARRGELVRRARATVGERRSAFVNGVSPEELVAVYGDARVVLDESGTRHHPITMRVFEAMAGGALRLGDEAPGLEQLLDPSLTPLLAEPFEQQLRAVLADRGSPRMAAAAREIGRSRHTYDHRVDELVAVLRATRPRARPRAAPADGGTLTGAVAADPQVQVLLQVGAEEVGAAHPDREVWTADELGRRLRPGAVEGVAIRTDDVRGHLDELRAAWRYVYVEGRAAGLEEWLADEHPAATVATHGDVRRVDLGASGYIVRPEQQ